MKNFDEFTNLYELSKTLRFELKPTDATKIMLEENKVFQIDEIIQEKYKKTKPYFDRLHREFVKESLSNAKLSDLYEYKEALKNVKNITRETLAKDKKALETILEKEEKRLRKEIVVNFDNTAKNWVETKYSDLKFEKKNVNFLFEKKGDGIFSVLEKRYGHEEDAFVFVPKKDKKGEICLDENGEVILEKHFIFDEWKGFTGYFTKFFETRKNFYKDEAEKGHGKAGQISTRIVDQNLRRFCDNINDFKKTKDKINFSEVEQNFNITMSEVFSLDFYNSCFLQDGIDNYNEILGGKTLENGEKLKGVNELINKYRQDHKGEKLPFLKTLDK